MKNGLSGLNIHRLKEALQNGDDELKVNERAVVFDYEDASNYPVGMKEEDHSLFLNAFLFLYKGISAGNPIR